MDTILEVDVRKQINDERLKQGRTLKWLATQAGINYSSFYNIIVHRIMDLPEEARKKINTAMGTNF